MTYLGDGAISAALARSGARTRIGGGSMSVVVLADVELTGGRYSLYGIDLGVDAGAAPHFHRTFAESFQIEAGQVELYDGAAWSQGGPGDHFFVPEGGIHAFHNRGPDPVRMLMMSTPGVRREAYFEEVIEVARTGRELRPEEWTELFARHDQYMV